MRDTYLSEENFAAEMEGTVIPFLDAHEVKGFCEAEDGTRLSYRYFLHPQEKAAILISHGFCEFTRKFDELSYYLYRAGFSVFLFEYRGHGFSDRAIPAEPEKVHVKSFREYVEDLHTVYEKVVKENSTSGRFYLYAHSMGGAIGALYLEEYPNDFSRALLSSPMLQMSYGGRPMWLIYLLVVYSYICFKGKAYAPGQHAFDGIPKFENSSCLSKARYDYVFHWREKEPAYRTYGGTYGWTRAGIFASKRVFRKDRLKQIKIPVLVCQAGQDTMVKNAGQERFAAAVETARLRTFPQSKHELFNDEAPERYEYFDAVLDFFEEA